MFMEIQNKHWFMESYFVVMLRKLLNPLLLQVLTQSG